LTLRTWDSHSTKMFKDRSTIDVVVITLAFSVCFILLFGTVGTFIEKLIYPEMDMSNAAEIIGNNLGVMTGAVVGFIGGRAVGRGEITNGSKDATRSSS
jgi:hypothetical protein